MIVSFKDKETEKVFNQEFSKKLPIDIQVSAFKKLQRMNQILSLNHLKEISGDRLEKLKGVNDIWSIRINKQWRIIFTVNNRQEFENVEIVDYH